MTLCVRQLCPHSEIDYKGSLALCNSHFEDKPTAPFFHTCVRLLQKGPMPLIDDTAFVCFQVNQAERSFFPYHLSDPGD